MEQARRARAREARHSMNKHHKAKIAFEDLWRVRKDVGSRIVTYGMVYNATGETLQFLDSHTFFGGFVTNPRYQVYIPNGA